MIPAMVSVRIVMGLSDGRYNCVCVGALRADQADSQTEGEELERARRVRMDEVKLKPLPYLPTDTETEVSPLYLIPYWQRLYRSLKMVALRYRYC